ncbi:MAG: hypothetical protein RIQ53_2397 [Pseudomonadota bacterium]|jgi:hypothetical protein
MHAIWTALTRGRGARLSAPSTGGEATHRGAADRRREPVEPLWLEWLALGGLLLFGAWVLGTRGVWALLLGSDPTGLTLVIILVFAGATAWCGGRARELQRQRALLAQAVAGGRTGWAGEYLQALRDGARDADAPAELLAEHTHGPHATAWWVNGIQLKLGLLGKVIGFSVLALQIGQVQSFDASQSQDLLRSLTSGLGIALLTTMVGLVGNILLGLQLTRLDRWADALSADIQRAGLALPPAATVPRPATER